MANTWTTSLIRDDPDRRPPLAPSAAQLQSMGLY